MRTSPLLALACLALSTSAQTISSIEPEAASAGDLVRLRGANLGATSSVSFAAHVGGFVQFQTIVATPQSVSATEVQVVLPAFGSFVPPTAFPESSSPVGVLFTDTVTELQPFYFMEATNGGVATLGTGTTQPGGLGKPVVSFDPLAGGPYPGNGAFALELLGAAPFQSAFLGVSLPGPPPYVPVGDGLLVLTAAPFLIVEGPFDTGSAGQAQRTLALPDLLGATVAFQWLVLDPLSGFQALSNALTVEL
jgi:hypothetical protein